MFTQRKKRLCLGYYYLKKKQMAKEQREKRLWVHPLVAQRHLKGAFFTMFSDLREDERKFQNYFRMSIKSFDELLSKLDLERLHCVRVPISPAERLCVTLRYLATGNTMTDLHYTYRIGISTISGIIEEVCTKIWELRNECMAEPSEEKWKEIANGFQKLANFPNCIGALDGKHVRIIKPTKSGSLFYNYKHYFSIVLMAICDANYCFTFVDVGAQGKFCDSSVFKNSNFYQKLENGTLKIPCPMPFPGNEEESNPFVIVADEAFGLSKNILRPYARNNLIYKKKIFNYRLSRARRNIECSFGILSNKFRIFHKPMNVSVELAVCIVKASCILHNFIRVRDGYKFENTLFTEGLEPLNEINNIQRHNDVTRCGTSIRDKFAQYFISDAGKVDWQDKCI